jgi:hypothetical protein
MVRMTLVAAPPSGTTIPETTLRLQTGGTGDGEIFGERGSSGLRAVRYALLNDADDPEAYGLILDWDGERQAFTGRRIEPIDVEIFRRTESAQ